MNEMKWNERNPIIDNDYCCISDFACDSDDNDNDVIVKSDDHNSDHSQGHDDCYLNLICLITAIFKWLSKVITWLRLLRLVLDL